MSIAFAMMAISYSQTIYRLAMYILGLGMELAGPGFMASASLAVSFEEQGAVAGIVGTYLYSIDGALPYWFALASYFLLFFFILKFSDKNYFRPAPNGCPQAWITFNVS